MFCCHAVTIDSRHVKLASQCVAMLCIDEDTTQSLLSKVVTSLRHVLRVSLPSQLNLSEDKIDRSGLRIGDENEKSIHHFEFLCDIISNIVRVRRRNWKSKGGTDAIRIRLSALTRLMPALVAALDLPFGWKISGSKQHEVGSKVVCDIQTSCLNLLRVLMCRVSPNLRSEALRLADLLTRGARNQMETPQGIVNASANLGEWLKTCRQCMVSFGLGVCEIFVVELFPCMLNELESKNVLVLNVELAATVRDVIAIASSKLSETNFKRAQNLLLNTLPKLLENEEHVADDNVLISMLCALEYCLTAPCGHERVESLLPSASRIFLNARESCSDRPRVAASFTCYDV